MLNVLTIPAFKDNYLWLIHNGSNAAVVDPGDAAPILAVLERHRLSLDAILLTHHHADHVGGVPQLLQLNKVPVFGPRNDAIPFVTHPLAEGDEISIPSLQLSFSAIDVPGHTRGHIAYYNAQQHWLFCGDTLFAGGCGRLFEGTPAQMSASLDKLAALPDETKVYCAHEYTLSNLRFAQEVEPENEALRARIQQEKNKRENDQPTVPSTIGVEKETNPFLRYRTPLIGQRMLALGHVESTDPIAVFAALRNWKNIY